MEEKDVNTGEFPYIEVGGERRYLACIPSPVEAKAGFPEFGAENPIIPESEIVAWLKHQPNQCYDLGIIGSTILDQNGCNGCSGWSATGCFTLAWNLMSQASEVFSPGYQYSRVNGNQDAGGRPTDNMNSLLNHGVCLLSDNPKDAFYRGRIPASAETSAPRFKLESAYLINGWEDLISAIVLNRPVNYGMQLGRGYMSVDQTTGIAPSGGYLGLHAQFIRGLFLHPALGGELVAINQNSWNKIWGIQHQLYGLTQDLRGCSFNRRGAIFAGRYFEANAMVAAVPDPKDPAGGIPVAKGAVGVPSSHVIVNVNFEESKESDMSKIEEKNESGRSGEPGEPGESCGPCLPMAASPAFAASAPSLALAGILPEISFILTTINAEVNPLVAVKDANAGWKAGGLKGALSALVADSANVFPDATTRPFAVMALGVWIKLIQASPVPVPGPTPGPKPAPGPVPLA